MIAIAMTQDQWDKICSATATHKWCWCCEQHLYSPEDGPVEGHLDACPIPKAVPAGHGAALIVNERLHQINDKRYTLDIDGVVELVDWEGPLWYHSLADHLKKKFGKDHVGRLRVAGAFIAAEIDRLLRVQGKAAAQEAPPEPVVVEVEWLRSQCPPGDDWEPLLFRRTADGHSLVYGVRAWPMIVDRTLNDQPGPMWIAPLGLDIIERPGEEIVATKEQRGESVVVRLVRRRKA